MMNFSIELVGLGRLQVGFLVVSLGLGVSSVGFCRVHKTLGSRDPDPEEGFSQVRKVWA